MFIFVTNFLKKKKKNEKENNAPSLFCQKPKCYKY